MTRIVAFRTGIPDAFLDEHLPRALSMFVLFSSNTNKYESQLVKLPFNAVSVSTF